MLIAEKSAAFPWKKGRRRLKSAPFPGPCHWPDVTSERGASRETGMRLWLANERAKTLEDCSGIEGRYLARAGLSGRSCHARYRSAAAGPGARGGNHPSGRRAESGSGRRAACRRSRFAGATRPKLSRRWVVDASGPRLWRGRIIGGAQIWNIHHVRLLAGAMSGTGTVTNSRRNFRAGHGMPRRSRHCHQPFHGTAGGLVHPLKGGDVSIGVVLDQRRVQWPEGNGRPGG